MLFFCGIVTSLFAFCYFQDDNGGNSALIQTLRERLKQRDKAVEVTVISFLIKTTKCSCTLAPFTFTDKSLIGWECWRGLGQLQEEIL